MSAPSVATLALPAGALRRLAANRAALASLAFLLGMALLALAAPLLPLGSPVALELERAARPPVLSLGGRNWPHRASLHVRFEEPPRSRDVLLRTQHTLSALVAELAGEPPRILPKGPREELTGLELALLYRPARDPARGSDLGMRFEAALASRMQEGGLHLRGGGEIRLAFEGLTARDACGPLGSFDAWLVARRHAWFGFYQVGPWLGTDALGRDLLARAVFGSRVSLAVALVGGLVSLVIGVAYGAVSGYFGGRTDERMMRLVDVLQSLPFLFVVIFVITLLNGYRAELAALGIGRMTAFFALLGSITWLSMARVVRGQVLSLRNQDFVRAARVLGASHARVLRVHVLPHLSGVVVVTLTLTLPALVLYEAFLSFLGLGVEPPGVSWGLLAADALDALNPLESGWWLVAAPALFMGATLFALNVLGDGLRDCLDPRLGSAERVRA